MARFKPAFNIWDVPENERHTIQPGQWVFAGDPANKGRFYGSGSSDVVAWLGNANAWRKREGGIRGYFRFMSRYGMEIRDRKSV